MKTFRAAAEWLAERGIPFEAAELELEMGQPLRSTEEARRLFRLYGRDEDKSVITDEFLRGKANRDGADRLSLYLPHKRPVGCLKFSSKNL
ncbi:MAG: hypothetical protein ACLUNQ_08985 [Oscillospiraceae bacterium]